MVGILAAAYLCSIRPDILIADFEGSDYGRWKAEGTAFGSGPAHGTLPGQMAVSGYKGTGLVNSFLGGDGSIGTLTSPSFKIERRYITFLIGGGKDLERTCMRLLVNGNAVRIATGPNDRPGGSEALAPDGWDVSELEGRTATIEIMDKATGGWGHINVDQIVQTDKKPSMMLKNITRTLMSGHRYLNFPIKNGAPMRRVTVLVDGKVQVATDIGLADGEPDWWAPMDVSAWVGKSITLQVDALRSDSKALSSIRHSDEIVSSTPLYQEPLRGQFHFSPRRGWNNDPNGLVYFKGEYHMFFQHNPYGWGWGNMHWGHAVSRDLVHWQELRDALAPDDLGAIYSGSAVVDEKDGKSELALFYTAAGNPFVQCLATSTDGRTFRKFSGNPVVGNLAEGNRDPKVFWYQPTKTWVMALYVERAGKHTIRFFNSTDLRKWTSTSSVEGFFECPDIFELPLDGDSGKMKWVLTAASSEYMVGRFDGKTFVPETPKLPGHRGTGFYAAQTFNNMPPRDGRRIQIGWFQTETRGMPFNQSMTIPMELKLISTADGPRLTRSPVKELEALRARSLDFGSMELSPGSPNPFAGLQSELLEVRAEFQPKPGTKVKFQVRGSAIVYDTAREELSVNGHFAPAPLQNGKQRITIYCDRTGLEVFASGGLTYVPIPHIADRIDENIAVAVEGLPVEFSQLQVYGLRSAWLLPNARRSELGEAAR